MRHFAWEMSRQHTIQSQTMHWKKDTFETWPVMGHRRTWGPLLREQGFQRPKEEFWVSGLKEVGDGRWWLRLHLHPDQSYQSWVNDTDF